MYGVDVRRLDDVDVHAAFTGQIPRQRRGMRLRQMSLAADEVVRVNDWLVTSPLRTAFDCARWLPFIEAVVVVDALAQARLIELQALAQFVREHPGVRWVRRAARVVAVADAGSESPMETRLRLLLLQAGFTNLQTQLNIYSATEAFVARVDLAFAAARVAVEYDGAWHWTQRREDDRRRAALRALGWTVLVYSAEDVYRHPHTIITEVGQALRRAAA
ncbi:MAG TPA: DUF559 domain-containing protein [Mycobacteriales bacterium]|nr:DUF559 domain-containing protein [Mycobacteriales bacterium]